MEQCIGENPHKFKIDSGSSLIRVENHAFTCMINNVNKFIDPLRTHKIRVVKVY